MTPQQPSRPSQTDDTPLAETGNASNPSPRTASAEPISDNQLLTGEAEKYLREGGNIEDVPDARDEEEAGEASLQNTGA